MKIKWLILVIIVLIVLAGTVSAQEMVRRVAKQADQPNTNVPYYPPTISLGAQYIAKSGAQQIQIPVLVNNVKDLTNMDLEVNLVPLDMSTIDYQSISSFAKTPSDFGNLRVINVEKGNLIGKALFDSQIKSLNDDILACKPWPCYGTSGSGPWHHETIQISFASSDGVSGQGSVAEIIFNINVPDSQLQNYGILAIGSLKNAGDSSGNQIEFFSEDGFILDNPFQTWVVMPGIIMKGDGDGDGAVTGKDAAAALQIAVGKQPYNPVYDMNGDGKVDSSDVREILKMSLQSSSIPEEGSQNSHAGTGSSTSQKGLTPETDKGGVSRDERISSIPIQLPKPRPQGAGGKISSIPIQLP